MASTSYVDEPPPDLALPAEDDDDIDTTRGAMRPMATVQIALTITQLIFLIGLLTEAIWRGSYVFVAWQYADRQTTWAQTNGNWDQLDLMRSWVMDVYWTCLVIGMLGFLWFNVRAVSNLKAFSTRHIPEGQTSVVLWQFAPGLNLIKPYQLMMLYWSRAREHLGEDGSHPAVAIWWWFSWLGGVFTATVAMYQLYTIGFPYLADGPHADVARPSQANIFMLAGSALSVLSIFCLLILTRRISRLQDRIAAA